MDKIPFNPAAELQIVGEYKSFFAGAPGTPRYNTPISPKENLTLLLTGKQPLWMATSTDYITLVPKVVPDNVARGFVFDADRLDLSQAGGADWFGVEWDYIPKVGGSMVRPGKPKVPDISRWEEYITFPDLDAMDWAGSAERNKAFLSTDRMNLVWVMNGIFERLISFVDFENAALAMIDEDLQDGVHRLFDALCKFYDKLIEKIKFYYNADILLFHDDWGSQRAPFFSLNTVREMLVPYLSRIVDSCHRRGMFFELHSCGKNEMLVPAMIESGVDIWSPQEMNDIKMLLDKYGDQLIFGVRAPLKPDMTEADLEQTAVQFFQEYGSYRGIIASAMAMGVNASPFFRKLYSCSREAYSQK